MRRFLALLATATLLVSCSSGGVGDTTTTDAPITTTSEPATTTTSRPAPTTTLPPSTTTTDGDPVGPEGSGCTPETDVLPDGEWYGQAADWDEDSIGFDLACWFSGEAAVQAAADDGEESPPPNDYYVRNESNQIRVLLVDPSTPVTWYPSGDPNDVVEGTYTDWVAYLEELEFRLGIWVSIENGNVTEIAEKWVP